MDELKSQVDQAISELQSIRSSLDALSNSQTLPRAVENALRERLGIDILVASVGTTGVANTQSVNTPAGGGTITVPAQPTGTVAIQVTKNGIVTTYNVLYQ